MAPPNGGRRYGSQVLPIGAGALNLQIEWVQIFDAKTCFHIGETFYFAEEAFCALDVLKQSGLPSVVTIAPIHIREVAEAMGRRPAASRYAPNMRKHFMYGDDEALPAHITSYGDKA
jgi:hypothetical protein